MQMYERYSKELEDLFNGFAEVIEKDYISKDKIREKIKELEELPNNQYIHLSGVIGEFKKLLEEK